MKIRRIRWKYPPIMFNDLIRCARSYEKELNNRNLLLVCMDKHHRLSLIEVSFRARNFMHLSGIRLRDPMSIPADTLYSRCISHRLAHKDTTLAPEGITPSKLETLSLVADNCLSAGLVTDWNTDNPVIYTDKFPGGFKGCIQLARDSETGIFVPCDMRKASIHRLSKGFTRVIATYRKGADEDRYSEIVHTAKGTDWSRISFPDEYSYLPKPV